MLLKEGEPATEITSDGYFTDFEAINWWLLPHDSTFSALVTPPRYNLPPPATCWVNFLANPLFPKLSVTPYYYFLEVWL